MEKPKKKRIASKIIIAIIILLFIAISVCYKVLPSILSHTLSKKMEVSVNINSITMGMSNIGIGGIAIGNPPPSILPQALLIKNMNIEMPIDQFFKKNIVIPKIDLSHIYIGLEFRSKGNNNGNWTFIMNNLGASSSKESSDINVLIKELYLQDVTVDIVYKSDPRNVKTVHFPQLKFYNVTSQGGIPSEQIARIVMRQALKEIFSTENLQDMLKGILDPAGGASSLFKGLFNFRIHFKSTGEQE